MSDVEVTPSGDDPSPLGISTPISRMLVDAVLDERGCLLVQPD